MGKIVAYALASLALVASEARAQNTRFIGKLEGNRSPHAVAALLRDFPCDPLWVSKALEDSKDVIKQGRVILETDACQKAPPSPWVERSRALLKQNVARKVPAKPPVPDPHLGEIENLKTTLDQRNRSLEELKSTTDLEKNGLSTSLSEARRKLAEAQKLLEGAPRNSNLLWAALFGALLIAVFGLVIGGIRGENFAKARKHKTVKVGGRKHAFTLVEQRRSGQGYNAYYQCDQCSANPVLGDKASLKKHVQEAHPGSRLS